MDQNKKMTVTGIAIALLASVAIFIFLIASTPPKEEKIIEQPIAQNIPNESVAPKNKTIQQNNPADEHLPDYPQPVKTSGPGDQSKFAGIRVMAIDENNLPISGLTCNLFVRTENDTNWGFLLGLKTDSSGVCYFYSLDSGKKYSLEISELSDKFIPLKREFSSDLRTGSVTVWGAKLKKMEAVSVQPLKCMDSDNGYNQYESGYVLSTDSSGTSSRTNDLCLGDGIVMEAVCDKYGYANNEKTFQCPKGCQNGACVK